VTVKAGKSLFEPQNADHPVGTPATDVILSWATFSAAADDAGMSRRWGGIHFKSGDLNGRLLGRSVGLNAWAKAQLYINGKTAG
jgi:vanadium-dependent haloperoxidase-like protein